MIYIKVSPSSTLTYPSLLAASRPSLLLCPHLAAPPPPARTSHAACSSDGGKVASTVCRPPLALPYLSSPRPALTSSATSSRPAQSSLPPDADSTPLRPLHTDSLHPSSSSAVAMEPRRAGGRHACRSSHPPSAADANPAAVRALNPTWAWDPAAAQARDPAAARAWGLPPSSPSSTGSLLNSHTKSWYFIILFVGSIYSFLMR